MSYGTVTRLEEHDTGAMRPGWRIKAEPHVMARLKRIFPRTVSNRAGAIVLLDTPELAHELRWVLERWPMELDRGARRHLNARSKEYSERQSVLTSILNGTRLKVPHQVEGAREYQLQAADVVLKTGRLLCTDELGLGKTLTGLLVFRDPRTLPGLVVCPTHLPPQWLSQLHQWLPWLRGHIVRTRSVYDPAEHREMQGHDPDLLIISYSKLDGWSDYLAGKVKTVIFDEAHELRRIGNSEQDLSNKYEAAAHIADAAEFRMGLTATPVFNYGQEAYNVISVLDPDALGTRAEFQREWGGKGDSVENPKALGYYLRESVITLRRTRKDVGRELPDVMRVPHSIGIDADAFERLAAEPLELAREIVEHSGPKDELWRKMGDFDWQLRHATGVGKAPYVAGFVRMLVEAGEKVLLFGWHHDVYDIWRRRLHDLEPVFYTGKESSPQKLDAKERFLEGESKVMVMSLRSGAGLDGLQEAAKVCVFGELDWSPAMHDQCIGRLHRDGQHDGVVAYFLVSDQGADPKMAEVLNDKRQQGEPIRDPDAELLGDAPNAHDRIRRLAEDFLAAREGREAAA